MKIAQVLLDYNYFHGHGKNVVNHVNRLCKGNEIHIFANTCSYPIKESLIFHWVPAIPKAHLLRIPSFFLLANFMVNLKNFDIVHIHSSCLLFSDVITAHFCHEGFRNIPEYNEFYKYERNFKRIYHKLFHFVMSWMEKIVYSKRFNKKVIAVSEKTKKEISKFYKRPLDDIAVIHNEVDIEKFNSKGTREDKELIRKKFNIPDDFFILLFISLGSQFGRKGLKTLLKSLELLKDKKLKLIIVGEVKEADYHLINSIKKIGLEDKVIMAGKQKEVERFYRASDLFIFPTLYDPCARVIGEAAACGTPVIVSNPDYCGTAELFTDKESAFILKNPKDPMELAKKINIAVENPEFLKKIAKNAESIIQNYSPEKVVKRTFSVYEEILKEKKKK